MRTHPIKPTWRVLEVLILLAIITAGSFFVHTLAQRVEKRMETLKEQVVAMLERQLGRRISYESISPSVFGFLAVRNFTVYSFDDPEDTLLRVSRLKIYYDLFRFLATKDPLQSLTEIQIANSQFSVDHDRDRELIAFLRSLMENRSGSGAGLPGGLPVTLSGANITLDYRHGDQEWIVSDLFFSMASTEARYRVSVRGSVEVLYLDSGGGLSGLIRERDRRLGGRGVGEPRELRRLHSRVRITGTVDQGFKWSDLGIRIYSLSAGGVALKRQTLQLVSDESGLKVRKIQDRAPLDIQVLFDVATGDLSFRFVAEGFRPSTLLELSGGLARYNRLLSSSLTGNGFATYNLKQGSLRYGSELEVALASGVLPVEATLRTHLRGNEKIVYLDPLSLDSPVGRVEFLGSLLVANLFPSGILTVDRFPAPEGKTISTSLEFRRGESSLEVNGRELRIGDAVFGDVKLDLQPRGREFGFALAAVLEHGSRPGRLGANGAFRLGPTPELSLSTTLEGLPSGTVARLLSPDGRTADLLASWLGPFSVSMTAELWTDFRRFSVSSPRVELVEPGVADRKLSFAAEATDQGLHVEDLELQWGEYRITGLLDAESSAQKSVARSLLWVQGIPYELEASYAPGGEISLKGSYGLDVRVRTHGIADPSLFPNPYRPLEGTPFQVRAASLPVPLPGGTLRVSLDVVGIYTSGGRLVARSDDCELLDIPLPSIGPNALAFGFLLQDRELQLNRVRYRDRISELAGSGGVTLEELAPLSGAARIDMADSAGSERYNLALDIRAGALNGELQFNRTPLARLGDLAVTGDAAGTIGVTGTLRDPIARLDLSLQDGRLNIDPLDASLSVRVSRERIEVQSLDLRFLSHRIENAKGSIDLLTGDYVLDAPYRAGYFGQDVRLSATLAGRINNPGELLRGAPLRGVDLDGSFRMSGILVGGEPRADWLLRLRAREGVLSVDGGAREGIHATIGADGRFSAVMLEPLPIRGTAAGQVRQGRIDSTFDVASLDMRIITGLTPVDDIWGFEAGTAAGSLRITGPINDPDWYGRMDVTGLLMGIKLSPDLIGPVNGTIFFDEKSFYFPRVAARTGKGTVEGEGVFYLDHWLPVAVELMLYIDKEPGGHIQYTFGPLFVDGYATGAIRVTSDESSVKVEGKVRALNCRVALERKETPESGTPPTFPPIPLTADVKIATGRGVEFFWPAMNFPVVHSYVKQGENIQVFLDESTGELAIKGRAEMRGGEVFYFDRSFYLKEGSITFEDTIGDIDPWIQALAEVRERDVNNEEVRIYLEANNKLSQFSPRFYSDPLRPDVEILNLVGGTILNRFEQTGFGTAAVMLTSDIVGQFGILTPFERAVREVLRLDLFSIRTQFLQNVLLGKILGQDSEVGTINPLDNTTLSLGKYLGTDLFLEALIRFQAVNEIDAVNNIRTEGELSLEWATPFFLLEWTFTPLHPESLFLADNSIGLSWKFSY